MPPNLAKIRWSNIHLKQLLTSSPLHTDAVANKTASNALDQRHEISISKKFCYAWNEVAEIFSQLTTPSNNGFLFVEDWLWETNLQVFNDGKEDFLSLGENLNDLLMCSRDGKSGLILDATVHVTPSIHVKDEMEILVSHWGM